MATHSEVFRTTGKTLLPGKSQGGIIPQSAQLTPRPKEIPSCDSQTPDQKKLGARQMETFAGFAEHTDHEVGRLVQALEAGEDGSRYRRLISMTIQKKGAEAPHWFLTAPDVPAPCASVRSKL